MGTWIEWVDPFDKEGKYPVVMRMSAKDVAAYQRELEPRYTSDEQAIDDFMAVNWARKVEWEGPCDPEVRLSAEEPAWG